MAVETFATDTGGAALAAARRAEQQVLCDMHYRKLAGYVYSLVGDPDIAREVTQEAFVRLFARWTKVRHPAAYLYLVATNVARAHWRRRRTDQVVFHRLVAERTGDVAAYDPALADAVARLPRRCRQVVVLHYFADLTVDQVAAELRLAPGSVKRLLHTARTLLAAALEDPR